MSDKHKVLLIEDDADYAKLVVTALAHSRPAYLNGRRFEVVRADRLSTGLERLAEGGIDVVLLDLMLPDSRGLDTFIKVHRSAPQLPVVVLTCIEDDAIVARAVQEGAEEVIRAGFGEGVVGVLPKPFRIDQLVEIAEETLGQPGGSP